MNIESITLDDLLECAACLWEHAQELRARRGARAYMPEVHKAYECHGAAVVRSAVIDAAAVREACLCWYLSEERREGMPFDWEFIPRWFGDNFDWETLAYNTK